MSTPRLNAWQRAAIDGEVDDIFDLLLTRLLGGAFTGKRLFVGYTHDFTLPGIFEAAVSEEGGRVDTEIVQGIAAVAEDYINKHRSEAKAATKRRIQGLLHDIDQGRLKVEDWGVAVEGEMAELFGEVKTSVRAVVASETQHAQTIGVKEGIDQINDGLGVEDPTVCFIPVKDKDLCKECRRIHLLPDGNTPRVFKSSEVSTEYHNRNDSVPSWNSMHPSCRCFWNGNVPVITEAGVKSLKKVMVGDFVLTHTGKFKKVLATFGREGREAPSEAVYRIEFRSPDGKLRKLRVTNDHLMLTGQGWMRADKLQPGGTLSYLFRACEACGESFPHDIQHPDHRFCSIQCVGASHAGKPGPRVGQSSETALEDIRRVALNSTGGYSFRPVTIERVMVVRPVKKSKLARLYDITVEDDASFVVMGVVSHNCALATVLPGFGFDGQGRITWVHADHKEWDYQRGYKERPTPGVGSRRKKLGKNEPEFGEPLLKYDVKYADLKRALEHYGWAVAREDGGHVVWNHPALPTSRPIPVKRNHVSGAKPIDDEMLRQKYLKEAGLTIDRQAQIVPLARHPFAQHYRSLGFEVPGGEAEAKPETKTWAPVDHQDLQSVPIAQVIPTSNHEEWKTAMHSANFARGQGHKVPPVTAVDQGNGTWLVDQGHEQLEAARQHDFTHIPVKPMQ